MIQYEIITKCNNRCERRRQGHLTYGIRGRWPEVILNLDGRINGEEKSARHVAEHV